MTSGFVLHCIDGGWLVGAEEWLPSEAFVRKGTRKSLGPGCNNLQCGRCGQRVLTRAVGQAALGATPKDTWIRLAASDWPETEGVERHYACLCHHESVIRPCPAPEPDPQWGATTPWRCAGHPALTPPCEALGVKLQPDSWQEAVERLAVERSMERRGSVGSALAAVFFALVGEEQGLFGEAMLAAVRSPDPGVRVGVLKGFSLLDVAPEWPRRLAQLALAEPAWTQLDRPLAPGEEDPDWWVAAAIAAIARRHGAVIEDQSLAIPILRRVAVAHRGADYLAASLAHLDPQWTAEHIVELAAVDSVQGDTALYALRGYRPWHAVADERLKRSREFHPR